MANTNLDIKRIERKIAANLITEPATSPEGKKEYQRIEQDLNRFKRQQPLEYQNKLWALVRAFQAFDDVRTRQAQQEITVFERRFARK